MSRKIPNEGGISITGLRSYHTARVHELLWKAAGEIEFRGDIAIGVHYNPHEDLVDAYGAICLAAGAKLDKILSYGDDLEQVAAPAEIHRIQAAVDAIEAWFDIDITNWSDTRDAPTVVTGLRFVADKIAVAVPQQ